MAEQDNPASSLRQTFPGYYRPTDDEFDRLWKAGMFVVDTNVLLNLYRYSRSTRDELLTVLRALGDKLFIPHQVGQEFLDKRFRTIRGQREGYARLRERVTRVREDMEDDLRKVLRLRPGEEIPEDLREALAEVPPKGYETLSGRLEKLEGELPQATNSPDDDEVWCAVEALVDGKVGSPYPEEQQRKAEEEAERRRNDKIPPGFKDERPGDYLLWSQTINEAKRAKSPVVLVTDDRKEDWWWIEHGEIIGPRPELVAEMQEDSRMPFYMYTPDRLMRAAKDRLKLKVSEESISEAEGFDREFDVDVAGDMESLLQLTDSPDLSDRERWAIQAHVIHGRGAQSIAEELGISGSSARVLIQRAMAKLREREDIDRPAYVYTDETGWQIVRRPSEEWNRPLSSSHTRVSDLYVRVYGDEDSITEFRRNLFRHMAGLATIDSKPAGDDMLGDVAIELRFRSPVPVEHAARILETTAEHANVVLASVTYSHFLPE